MHSKGCEAQHRADAPAPPGPTRCLHARVSPQNLPQDLSRGTHTAQVRQRARVAIVMLLILDLMGFMVIGLWPGDCSWPVMALHHNAAAPLTASADAGLLQDATVAQLLARLVVLHPDMSECCRDTLQTIVRWLTPQDMKGVEKWTCQLWRAAWADYLALL